MFTSAVADTDPKFIVVGIPVTSTVCTAVFSFHGSSPQPSLPQPVFTSAVAVTDPKDADIGNPVIKVVPACPQADSFQFNLPQPSFIKPVAVTLPKLADKETPVIIGVLSSSFPHKP